MTTANRTTEISLLVALSLLWGGSFALIKVAVDTVPPATIVAARLAIGAALLMLLVRARAAVVPRSLPLWGMFAVQGILQSALPFTLISWSERHIDSALAGLLNTTPPLFVFLIGALVLRDGTATLRHLAGIVIGFAGVLVILGPAAFAGATAGITGQIAVTGASLSYAVAALYARRFTDQPALLTAACSMTTAALMMAAVSLAWDRPWTLAPSAAAVGSILALGVLSTALAMVIYFRLVRTLGALAVSSGSYLRAGFSVLFGVLLLREDLNASLVVGLVLILLGVGVVTGHVRWPRAAARTG